MNWRNIYYKDGTLRDIYIENINLFEIEQWLTFVSDYYKASCYNTITDETTARIPIPKIMELLTRDEDFNLIIRIYLGSILINTYIHSGIIDLESDIDPREFKSEDNHQQFMNYLSNISKLLSKRLLVTSEGSPDLILLTVNGDEFIFR